MPGPEFLALTGQSAGGLAPVIEALGYAPGDDGRYLRCRARAAGPPARPSPAASPFAALRGLRLSG